VGTQAASFIAECFWPGVSEADLAALDRRIRDATARSAVRYLGATLVRDDEVVLCAFEGTDADVRAVAERANVPFERILETFRYRTS
jgi:hypothetical protein